MLVEIRENPEIIEQFTVDFEELNTWGDTPTTASIMTNDWN